MPGRWDGFDRRLICIRKWLAPLDGYARVIGHETRLRRPPLAIVLTNGSDGHWTVAADDGIFTYGGANFLGSMGGQALNAPVVGFGISP
jgi:hypothetical protein